MGKKLNGLFGQHNNWLTRMEREPHIHQALQQCGCGRCHGGNMDRFTDKDAEAQRPLIGPRLSNKELRGTGGVLPGVSDA